MSMIQSAQVFSPRPSHNPRDNLRVLQSPFKPFSATGGKEDIVRLVDGDNPKVVEDGQDLVIMEDVQPQTPGRRVAFVEQTQPVTPTPTGRQQNGAMIPIYQSPLQLQSQPQPTTPRRRSAPSLHRAVLIRSAQRAAVMLETQQQDDDEEDDELEEVEVEEAVSGELMPSSDSDEVGEGDNDDQGWLDGEGRLFFEQDVRHREEHSEEQDITEVGIVLFQRKTELD